MKQTPPPQFVEGEQAILAGLLLDNSQAATVFEVLDVSDLYKEPHRFVFSALRTIFDREMPLDFVTLTDELQKGGKLEAAGGTVYLTELIDAIPSASNLSHYVRIVKEKALLRRFISSANEISSHCHNGGNFSEIINQIEEIALKAAGAQAGFAKKRGGLISLKEVMGSCVNYLDKAFEKKTLPGISSGFGDIDRLTAGFQNGDLIIIAGRPGSGKTAMMLGLVVAAAQQDMPCHVFSLEMPRIQLGLRMISKDRAINLRSLRTGEFGSQDWSRITDAIGNLGELPIEIDDASGLSPAQIKFRIREKAVKSKQSPALVAIDYLQLMSSSKRVNSREESVSSITRELKQLAKELNCPVIALSQLNRKVEERPNKRPLLSDLRESGAIEQDADVVMFLYREGMYSTRDEDQGKAEAIIAKQRNGPIGTVDLQWEGTTASYWSKRKGFGDDSF